MNFKFNHDKSYSLPEACGVNYEAVQSGLMKVATYYVTSQNVVPSMIIEFISKLDCSEEERLVIASQAFVSIDRLNTLAGEHMREALKKELDDQSVKGESVSDESIDDQIASIQRKLSEN